MRNFDDLQHLLSRTKKNFDKIAISETRITNQVPLLNNLNLNNYSFEFTPTETSARGTLLYIANHPSFKCCNDLNIYKKNDLESTFIEIVNPKEQKSILLLENFMVNLLNYNEHNHTNEFLDSLASNSSIPLILQPTRITSH